MSKDSIRLHPEHGVNPTMPVCFFCGQDKGEIALLGAAYKGEAPSKMVLDYEPCDSCRAMMDKGITLIEAQQTPVEPGQPPIQEGVYPTGSIWVLKEEAVKRCLNQPMLDKVLAARKTFIDRETADQLGLRREEQS